MMLAGVLKVAPVAVMIMFAILYFGLMLEVGLFEPLVRALLLFVGGDPLRLCLASVALPMLVALDGDGATTFLISTTALLPVHRRLGLRPIILPGLIGLAAGVMNILPWGGATTRAMAVLQADSRTDVRSAPAADDRRAPLGVRRRAGVWRSRAPSACRGAGGRSLHAEGITPAGGSSRMFAFNAGAHDRVAGGAVSRLRGRCRSCSCPPLPSP